MRKLHYNVPKVTMCEKKKYFAFISFRFATLLFPGWPISCIIKAQLLQCMIHIPWFVTVLYTHIPRPLTHQLYKTKQWNPDLIGLSGSFDIAFNKTGISPRIFVAFKWKSLWSFLFGGGGRTPRAQGESIHDLTRCISSICETKQSVESERT